EFFRIRLTRRDVLRDFRRALERGHEPRERRRAARVADRLDAGADVIEILERRSLPRRCVGIEARLDDVASTARASLAVADEEREAIERVVDEVAREPMLLDGERDLGVLSCVLGEVAPGVALHLGELADGQRSEIRFRDLRRAIDPTAQLALLLLGEL